MTICSLLIFASASVQLKLPKEGDDNTIIQIVKWLSGLDVYTYFEINYLLKTVIYPNIFHSALHMSRLIDVAPDDVLR